MKKRIDSIDILRLLMALIIVVYHSFLVGFNIFPGGGIATEFFFITTGGLMNISLIKDKNTNLYGYIKKKYSKIILFFGLHHFQLSC